MLKNDKRIDFREDRLRNIRNCHGVLFSRIKKGDLKMYYLIHILYGLFFALSLLGYALLYKTKTKLPICFFPVTAISGMTVTVYLFGLVGFLKAGCFIVVIGGWLCLWFYRNWRNIKEIITDWSVIFAVFAVVWLFIITRHSGLSHWDDFTHWYRICKAMNYDGTYPITPDIKFYTYVPGTATWIYIVTRFIGFNVSNCFFAQGILNICCLICMFSAIENIKEIREKLLATLVIGISGIIFLSFDISTYALPVDTLVGLSALTVLIISVYAQRIEDIIWLVSCAFLFMSIIKNSCLLFIMITLIFLGIKFSFSKRQWLKYFCFWGIIPFILHRLYFIRASIFYSDVAEASQNISLSRFYMLFNEKDKEILLEVTKNFLIKITDVNGDKSITTIYILAMIFIVIYTMISSFSTFIFPLNQKYLMDFSKRIRIAIIVGTLIFLVYCLLLLGTYIFSMENWEAVNLTSFCRYISSVAIYLVGSGIWLLLRGISSDLFTKKYLALFTVFLLCIFMLSFLNTWRIGIFNINGYNKNKTGTVYSGNFWDTFQNNIPEGKKYTDNKYIVFWDKKEFNGYNDINSRLYYCAVTYLRSNNILIISSDDIHNGLKQEVLESLSTYDYVIMLSDMSDNIDSIRNYLPIKDYHVGICLLGGD